MDNYLYVLHGDLTRLAADALAYSASNTLATVGHLFPSFSANVPGFADWFQGLRNGEEMFPIGQTFWLPLSAGRQPHGVVVVVAAGKSEAGEEEQAHVAVRSAIRTAVQQLRAAGKTGRLLIALPTFRLGRARDRFQALGSARIQIRAARETMQEFEQVDVAFVAYTAALYQTFLAARREVVGPAQPAWGSYPGLERALGGGECVLFFGAGLSRGAGLPDWRQLIGRLAHDLKISSYDHLDYLDVAQWYREHPRFGPAALAEVVRQTFDNADGSVLPTLAHYLLLALPVRHVITTNYDDLIETTLTALKRHPVRVARQADVARTGEAEGVFVVKLHGDAASPDDVVLCRDDYDAFFQQRPAMAALLEGLLLNQTFLFLGYGLRDPNFRQVFSRIALMLREAQRPAFATTFETTGGAGAHLVQQWKNKQLTLIPIPGDGRADQEQNFLRFLDGLAEVVTLRSQRLLLAPDTDVSEPLRPLRHALIEDVGKQVLDLAARDQLESRDVPHVVALLEFLSSNGWRPLSRVQLCDLWEWLAGRVADRDEQRRLFVAALRYAERFDDVQRIREHIEKLEESAV